MSEEYFRNSAGAVSYEPTLSDAISETYIGTFSPTISVNLRRSFLPHDIKVITDKVETKETSTLISPKEKDDLISNDSSLSQNQQLLNEANFTKITSARISYLAYKPQHEGSQKMNSLALRKFLKFWLEVRDDAAEPDLVLCNNGNLQAEWYKNSKKHLIIEFSRLLAICVFFNGDKLWQAKEDILDLARTLKEHSASPLKWQ